jgi:hypothetical protein
MHGSEPRPSHSADLHVTVLFALTSVGVGRRADVRDSDRMQVPACSGSRHGGDVVSPCPWEPPGHSSPRQAGVLSRTLTTPKDSSRSHCRTPLCERERFSCDINTGLNPRYDHLSGSPSARPLAHHEQVRRCTSSLGQGRSRSRVGGQDDTASAQGGDGRSSRSVTDRKERSQRRQGARGKDGRAGRSSDTIDSKWHKSHRFCYTRSPYRSRLFTVTLAEPIL